MPGEPPENDGEKPPEPVEETSAAEEWGRFAVQAGYLLGGGIQMAGSTLLGWFVGRWIDGKAGTGFVTPAAALLGFVAGVYSLWRMLQRLNKRGDEAK
ncbi:MAG TPA: AtpZ/AtpI family protein [bacterium]|nr:AtpZ/AtpI family protein [bacterium]